ncbi:MAG: ACP S-malonyltransferase [Gammaproteobacteria bacterium]
MSAYIFPGQGSQEKGMGQDLFHKFPEMTAEADEILGYSIETLCLNDPHQQLNQTQFTQPALYVMNALSYRDRLRTQVKPPNFLIGHSLGEYNALLAAEVFDFATGLKLVKKRGELMSEAANGAMAAIIGLKADAILSILEKNDFKKVAIANYNSHTQIVISGERNEVAKAQVLCEQAAAMMVVPLKVSGAFHSPLMENAQNAFEDFLNQYQFALPTMPVISNVTAKPYRVNEIKKTLAQQISNPVRWTESIEYLMSQGVANFEEIGPGKVLTGLIRRIQSGK